MILLLACAKPVSPWEAPPSLPEDWSPHAALVLSNAQIEALIPEREWPESLQTLLPSGIDATIWPQVQLEERSLQGEGETLVLHEVLTGDTRILLENETGQLEATVGWTLVVDAQVVLQVVEGVVEARIEDLETTLEVEQLPPEIALVAQRELQSSLDKLVTKVPSFPIAELPAELADFRFATQETGLAVELVFSDLDRWGEPDDLPQPTEGWALVVPEQTLLGLARRGAREQGVVDGYWTEPVGLSLDDGFALELVMWPEKRLRRPRDLQVSGAVSLHDDQLVLEVQDAESFMARRALDEVEAAIVVPAEREDRGLRTTIEGVSTDGALVMQGSTQRN